jgi:succinoglycan biosynthesis protein ExoV
MQLYYWSAQGPNLGDSLNPWLWPLLLPGFFDDEPRELFVGIGSNLGHRFPDTAKKIVVGTGYGGYQAPPLLDAMWDVRFVRGPRTAQVLGIDRRLAIGDPGMLVHQLGGALPPPGEHHAVGFMPHWESALYGAWEAVCDEAGAHFIDPRDPVESILASIRGCDLLVTEAMHGAIVADALRVPWVPFMPLPAHRFKWFDWAASQRLDLQFAAGARSTWLEGASGALEGHERLQAFVCVRGLRLRSFGSRYFRARACAAIVAASSARPYLSSNAMLETTTDAMLVRIDQVRRDYSPGC